MSMNKERGSYPAIGKAAITDTDAFIKWYQDEDGFKWLYIGDSYKTLIHDRQNMIGDMVPNYHSMYRSEIHNIQHYIDIIRRINGYMQKIGGRYDLLLYEPELSAIQFGGHRFLIPTRFLTVALYPDYKEKSLAELNRMALGEPVGGQSQSDAMIAMGSLTVSGVNTDMGKQNKLLADADAEIAAVKADMEQKIAAIKETARVEMQKIERMKLCLQVTVEELKTKIFMLESVIYSVECYIGDTVDFIQLRKGMNAPIEAPLVVHQKLRYLDEDLPILVSIYGFRFGDSEMFEEALKNRDDLVEYFCPGDKCMSFVRVSKTATTYGTNDRGMLAEYDMYHGKTIGILLRNGENLYFGWTDESKIMLPDGNVFYTPKTIEIDPEDTSTHPDEIKYPSSKYNNEQLEAMAPEEKKELEDKDRIAFHLHQRGLEKQKIMSKVFIFSIIQGLLDNTDLVKIPEKVKLLSNNPAGSRYLIFSNADGWLEDNRYGNFSDILKRFEGNHKVGDVILSAMGLSDGRYSSFTRRIEHNRSIDGTSRTHDCSLNDKTLYKINLIQEHDPEVHVKNWSSRKWTAYFVSIEKQWSDANARSNFEIKPDEFINLTFLNSDWLHYAILNKKLGHFIINEQSVSYAYAVRYLKIAYEYLQKRESEELAMIAEHLPDVAEQYPVWMVSLSDWKEKHWVRRITPYQAKRFAKWLQERPNMKDEG